MDPNLNMRPLMEDEFEPLGGDRCSLGQEGQSLRSLPVITHQGVFYLRLHSSAIQAALPDRLSSH